MIGAFSLRIVSRSRNPLTLLFHRHFSSNSDEQSFAVSYLIEKCGLSPKSALSVAKRINFHSPERQDAAISFFNELGFSKSQLSRLVRISPQMISCPDARKLYTPKIDFFKSKGLSGTELVRTVSIWPGILHNGLHGCIIPRFDYFKGLLGSDDKVILLLKRYPLLLNWKPQLYLEPNMALLQHHGVPRSNILHHFYQEPRHFFGRPDKFKVAVEEITRMGVVSPLKLHFLLAVKIKIQMSESKWVSKLDVYKRWGLSEEDVLRAFAKRPWFMAVSEVKLAKVMDTYVNKLGFETCVISKCPTMVSFSLERRITPRSLVLLVLISKGFIEKSTITGAAFDCSEKLFVERFVTHYEEKVPYLSFFMNNNWIVGGYEEQLQLSHVVPQPLLYLK